MKKISKTINLLLSAVFIVIAIFVVYIAFPQFGNQALIVRSGSMTPNIPVGAIVVAKPTSSYGVGDVITFRSEKNDKTMITHRITSVETDSSGLFYKTQGDANEEEDGWLVRPEKVVGKVNFTIPYAGQFLTFVKSDRGFFAMIVIPAIFVMVLETWNIISEIRKRRKAAAINKPFDGFGFNENSIVSSVSSKSKLMGLKIIIPFLLIASLAIPGTYALLSDSENSIGNVFQAAAVFPTVVPSITPSISPTISPSITPSVSPTPTPAISNLFLSNGYDCSTGASDTSTVRGSVVITKTTDLSVNVTITGATPNTTFDLWVNQDPGACPLNSPTVAGFITTDVNGDGANSLNNHGLVGGATNYWVSLVGGSDVLRSSSVSF